MSPNVTDHLALGKVARITGGFYLGYFLASVLPSVLGHIGALVKGVKVADSEAALPGEKRDADPQAEGTRR